MERIKLLSSKVACHVAPDAIMETSGHRRKKEKLLCHRISEGHHLDQKANEVAMRPHH